MPSEAEREEVLKYAALHLRKLIMLRRSARATQIEHQVSNSPLPSTSRRFDGSNDDGDDAASGAQQQRCQSHAKAGICVSALEDTPYLEPHTRAFLVPMSDDIVRLFTEHESQLRKLTRLTKCSIELARSAVLRRRGKDAGWLKYAKITVRGPTIRNILTLDEQLRRKFPFYQARKPSDAKPSAMCLFVSEQVPDNSSLLLGNQRTGACRPLFGALQLPTRRRGPGLPDDFVHLRTLHGYMEPARSGGFREAADFLYQRCPRGRSASQRNCQLLPSTDGIQQQQ